MTHNEKVRRIKKYFMDFFFNETFEGYNADTIDSKKHFGINALCEDYAEKVLSQLNAIYKPRIDEKGIKKIAKIIHDTNFIYTKIVAGNVIETINNLKLAKAIAKKARQIITFGG